jgi:membrane associated rhomboid family serine protease
MNTGFPAFRGAVRGIVIASTAVYVAILLGMSFASPLAQAVLDAGILSPDHVRHGWIWQLVTYAFVAVDPLQFLFGMLGVYFIGSAVEQQVGPRRFLELYFFSVVTSGLAGFLLSFTGVLAQGVAFTAGSAANALLMVFYLLYRDAPIMLFPIPIPIPVKYIVIFTAAVEGAYLLLTHFSLFYVVLLFGLGSGYCWHALARRRTFADAIEDRWLGVRNRYYRWKRRRAARKFEVYMRKQEPDAKRQYFDEYGNYRAPGAGDKDKDKDAGDRKPWIH